ncbi:hypothetical protein TUM20286_10080 [Pseudomonas tohonis]|uniref:Uncharacterized protein n=1 Tax=Pseudomonas tohonis TaxID=2725477 RepID=A0ABQ4VUI6_9PSED|nr:hypothetical protein TUM20286_10080 [Pseudomonas tohonis]
MAIHLIVLIMEGLSGADAGQGHGLGGLQRQAGLFPGVDAVTVPVEIAVAQRMRAPLRVPAQPAVGTAVEDQRPLQVALAGLAQVVGEVGLPARVQLAVAGVGQPQAAGQVGVGFVGDEAAFEELAAVDVDELRTRVAFQQLAQAGGVQGAGVVGLGGRGAAVAVGAVAVGGEQRRLGVGPDGGREQEGQAQQ